MLGKLLQAKRSHKRIISIFYDVIAISFALYLAISLRLGVAFINIDAATFASFAVTLIVSLFAFIKLGLYRAILRYAPIEAVTTVFLGTGISAFALASSSFFLHASLPRSQPIIYFLAAFIILGAPRLLMRNIVCLLNNRISGGCPQIPIIIYGAGYSGYQLSLGLESERSNYRIVAFVDDNAKLAKSKLRGINVYHSQLLQELATQHKVKTVLLAMASAHRSQKSQIIQRLENLHLKTLTIPAMEDIVSGKARISDIKPVALEDLLGRDQVPPMPKLMGANLTDKNIMVTGAGGSIGSELCRKIIKEHPKRLVLLESSEYNLYSIEQELVKIGQDLSVELIPVLGNVKDQTRLRDIMTSFQINTVYHAAAYKHVPLVETNVIEGISNNVLGTWYCAEAAIASKVDSFVLVSTDKAVRPTNIMGTTKRVAELVLQGLTERQSTTRFTMVRFGNVLGSSGSVVPLFRKQIAAGGPITVTHPDITRYFMTISEAAELVIQAGSMGEGGDVFVLDMGEPVKIVDLAKQMIHLSGLDIKNAEGESGDIAIEFIGLRPGEKLYEELLVGDNVTGTQHQLIMRAEEEFLSWKKIQDILRSLVINCTQNNVDEAFATMLVAPTNYQGPLVPSSKIKYESRHHPKLELIQSTSAEQIA